MQRHSGRSSTCSAVAARAKKIEKLLAERFRAHWKAVETDLGNGVDVAKQRAWFFLASDSRTSQRMARRYYTPARATKFANSSIEEVVTLCWAWFIPFQMYAHRSGSSLRELGDQLGQLVAAEYVAMTWGLFDALPEYDWDPSSPEFVEASSHYDCPDLYYLHPEGEVYESIVMQESGHYLRICKSVAEPFLKAERDLAMAEIEFQFFANAEGEGDDPRCWRVDFRYPEHSRALIEADIVPGAGSSHQKDTHRLLTAQLKANGTGYVKRPRPRFGGWD